MNNYIYEYHQNIQDGSIVVGEYIKKWYEYIIKGLESKSFFYDAKKAKLAINFIENFCHHHEGTLAPELLKLELWQKAFLSVVFGIVDKDGLRQFREVLLIVARKNGKAVSLDTEIATPSGWVQMKDINEGDLVFGQDGKPSKVLYVSPIFDKPMYLVKFEDGATVKASADHIWSVQTKQSRRANRYELSGKNAWAVKNKYRVGDGWYDTTTEEMAADFSRTRADGKGTEYKYRVPMANAVEYAEKNLPIDPYTFGVWLGDGNKGSTEVSVSTADLLETQKNIESEGHTTRIRYPNPMRDALRELGVFNNKHIPDIYLQASIEQRTALLQGLMDTDGYCSKAGQCEFCQKDERIADQMRELLSSLGIKSNKRQKTIHINGKECYAYSVTFYTDKAHPCFRMQRKAARLKDSLAPRMNAKSIVSIEPIPSEPSKCIMIDNESHLYLVGRNYTATHNTLFAAGIAEYMTFLDDYGARIYFAAPKLEQSRLCFEAFCQSIKREPELNELAKKRRTDVYVESRNATAQPLAFSERKSDGLNVSLCVADEIAAWKGEAGLKFYEVIKSSFGARKQPLLMCITTANYESGGIYDELTKRATSVINGTSREKRLAPFLYTIDDPSKWNDINELRKSNPNLSVSVSVDYLLEEIAIAEGSLSKKAEFLTKYCNIKQSSSAAWLNLIDIQKNFTEQPIDLNEYKNCYGVGGIDLSQTTDLTSCCIVIEKDGKLNVVSHFFMPAEKIDEAIARDGIPYRQYIERGWLTPSGDNFIDYNDCYKWFTNLIEQYKIYPLKIGYDRYSAQYLIQDLNAYGFNTDDVYQGENLTPVIQETEGLVKDTAFNFGDNQLLKIHLANAAMKINNQTARMRLIKTSATDRIDGTAALLDAMTVRQKWYAEIGEQLKNNRR